MTGDLIKRIEAGEGPSRELDTAIADCVGWRVIKRGRGFTIFNPAGEQVAFTPQVCFHHYTASIDAALSLLPREYAYSVGTSAQDGFEHYDDMDFGWAQLTHREHGSTIDCEAAANPALALCAAILKARGETTDA